MGACATKPKVSKNGAQAPEPAEKEEIAEVGTGGDSVPDEKKVVDREIDVGGDTVKEVDDESSKRRSLSNLLKENENGGKEAKEGDSAEAEPVDQEASETVKPAEPELQVPDHPAVEPAEKEEEKEKPAAVPTAAAAAVEKVEVPVVEPTPVFSAVDDDAPVKAEVEKVNEVATAEETVAEKTIEVTK